MIKTPDCIKKIIKSIPPSVFNPNQYVQIRDSNGYIKLEHRIIWEKHYGKIPIGAIIHHINGNKKDNRIENLMMFPSNTAHMNYHKMQYRLKKANLTKYRDIKT